jgi:acyl-CoA synthetase (NDP forming)
MSMVPYAFMRAMGIGVKHSHATGNEADLSVADFTYAVVRDPDVKLVLLYIESLKDPVILAEAAREALRRGVKIIALKAGVSEQGQAAASSHTGAIATEDHVIDAFFRQHGILRVPDMRSLVLAARLYLQGWTPQGTQVVAISNSGACCVMAADAATRHGLKMEALAAPVQKELKAVLPAFASTLNPIDLTAALLSDSGLFGQVLPIVANNRAADGFLISLPMSGKGYDVPRFAQDARDFVASTGAPTVVASPLASTRSVFESQGLVTFEHDEDAMAALGQFLRHERLCDNARRLAAQKTQSVFLQLTATTKRFLSEAESLEALRGIGIRVADHAICHSEKEAADAASLLGDSLAVKACSSYIPHKSEFGLVLLGVQPADAGSAYREIMDRAEQQGLEVESVIVAKMVKSRREFIVGGRWDPKFGAVVMVGDGGKYVEAMPDVITLVYPFDFDYAMEQMQRLRIAALFEGVRGDPPLPVAEIARVALRIGSVLHASKGAVASIDINPLMVSADGKVMAVDALIELGGASSGV